MANLFIKNGLLKDGESLKDIIIKDGVITKIGKNIENKDSYNTIDAKGRAILPTLVESHIHPDKAYLEERLPNKSGTLAEAIKNTAELKSKYTYEDVYERSERVIKNCIKNGCTIMRAHPDVDPFEKLLGVKVLLELKEKYKDILDMQIVAFPQEGFIRHPEVFEYIKESIKMGVDVVGGCPYSENNVEDTKKQLEKVFDLAQEHNLPIDMHADFGTNINEPRNNVIEFICDLTIERNYQGKVTLGHVNTLGSQSPKVLNPILEKISKAGITIIPLPATDLFMTGQEFEKDIPRGMAPLKAMINHNINVATSTNNIRNAFTPFNEGNLLTIAYLLQVSQQMGSASERRKVLDMITYNPAKSMGLEDSYGLEESKNGDIVIFNAYNFSDLINDQPIVNYVIKRGNIIVNREIKEDLNPLLV